MFYDWFGAKQNSQRFYEDAAVDDLVAHGGFGQAYSVLEFGCGTGRLADRLLSGHLPAESRYRALDISTTMVRLTQQRLERWRERVRVEQTSGGMVIAAPDASIDRFVSCYVLDLLSEPDIRELVEEAGRVVAPDGLFCCVCSVRGTRLSARIVGAAWGALFRLNPKLVGGCRPVAVRDFLDSTQWSPRYSNVVTRFGVSSEIVVAARTPAVPQPA
jgi:SAM-dependent methyltransferase